MYIKKETLFTLFCRVSKYTDIHTKYKGEKRQNDDNENVTFAQFVPLNNNFLKCEYRGRKSLKNVYRQNTEKKTSN